MLRDSFSPYKPCNVMSVSELTCLIISPSPTATLSQIREMHAKCAVVGLDSRRSIGLMHTLSAF